MAYRIDRGSYKAPQRRADGTIVADAVITRPGVFTYLNHDGTTRDEWRPEEEVFDPTSLASLAMVPLTNEHPDPREPRNAALWSRLAVGAVGTDVRRDGDEVAATVGVHSADAIADVEAGKRELSAGYEVVEDWTPGVVPAGRVDAGRSYHLVQRTIRYDHAAMVAAGRAGTARLRMDGAAVMVTTTAGEPGKDALMDPKELQALMERLAKAEARADAAEDKLKAAIDAQAKAEARADAAVEAQAKAEKARDDAATGATTAARARFALEAQVAPVLRGDSSIDVEKAPARDLKLAFIKKVDGKDFADKPDAYIDVRFDMAVEAESASRGSFVNTAVTVDTGSRNDGDDAYDKARADHAAGLRKLNAQPFA